MVWLKRVQTCFIKKDLNALKRRFKVIRDTKLTLQYCDQITWHPEARVLDIGCGCGTTTFDLLLPLLPENFCSLTGVDISDKMVQHCQSKSKDPRINFAKLDVGMDNVPEEFRNNFHHIFSFFCLHWLPDQKLVFTNMYNMMKPGGSLLISTLSHSPIFEIYEKLGKMEKWVPYNNNWSRFQPAYKFYKNVEEDMKEIISSVGFKCVACKVDYNAYTYSNFAQLRDTLKSVCAIIPYLPKECVEDFMDDYMELVRTQKGFVVRYNESTNEEEVEINYELLNIFCFRP